MKTYSLLDKTGHKIVEKKTITEIYHALPPGSTLVSGNREMFDRHTEQIVTLEVRAIYRTPRGQMTLVEDV